MDLWSLKINFASLPLLFNTLVKVLLSQHLSVNSELPVLTGNHGHSHVSGFLVLRLQMQLQLQLKCVWFQDSLRPSWTTNPTMVSHIKQLEFLLTTRVFWDRHFPLIHGIFKQCLLKVFFKLAYKLVCFHMTSHIFSLAKCLFIPPFRHTNSDHYHIPVIIFCNQMCSTIPKHLMPLISCQCPFKVSRF